MTAQASYSSARKHEISTDGVPDYENEQVFQRNRLLPRAYWIPETSILLNGEWEFNYARNPLHAPQPQQNEGKADGSSLRLSWATSDLNIELQSHEETTQWTKIAVPGHWQLQGFGRPQYTNVIYPFPVCPPHVPSENPTGTYRRKFSIPRAWMEDSQFRLRFEGVDSAYHVWVNGKFIGYHQGSRNPGEFDITSVVNREEQNELFVRVYQWCDGSYIEDQDQWWLSGIFRDVYVLAFPSSSYIDDYNVRTSFDADFENGMLDVSVNVSTHIPVMLEIELLKGTPENLQVATETVDINESRIATIRFPIERPHKWTAETPYLYDLRIRLSQGRNSLWTTIQTIETKVGFRQVEIKNGHLLVNNKHIILQGVNRHDHHPRLGRAVPLSFIRQDLLLMKRHNINAIRCSHYPPNPKMLELCDELGFWVIDEADLECHGFYDAVARPLNIPEEMDYDQRKRLTFSKAAEYTSNNPKWRLQYLDRVENLVQRDKNRASVIIWSLGNEAFYGCNHKSMYDYVKQVDTTRPVHYEGDSKAATADMFSYMYPSTRKLVELSKTEGVVDGKYDKPIILCEYAHAMGNGPGNLEGYQDLFRTYPRLQGGFIWEWANHGLSKHEGSKHFYAYGGDFNDFPNDGTFVMDGLCFSDHTPTPGLIEYRKVISPIHVSLKGRRSDRKAIIAVLSVKNHYDFIDLSHINTTFKVEALNKRSTILQTGSIELPAIQPGEAKDVEINLNHSDSIKNAEIWLEINLTLKHTTSWADAGHEIAWFQCRLDGDDNPTDTIPRSVAPTKNMHLKEMETQWRVSNDLFELCFDRSTGGISSWKTGGKDILLTDEQHPNAIVPAFWRAPTDNDMPRNSPCWRNFGVDSITTQVRSVSIERLQSGDFEITGHLFLAPPILDWGFEAHMTYRVSGDGFVQTKITLRPKGKKPVYLPRVGLDIRIPCDFQSTRYLGLGPGESYPDKKSSQRIGIYKSHVQDLSVNYEVPQENGNRMDARYVQLLDERSSICLEASRQNNTFSWAVDRFTTEAVEKAKHPCDLKEDDALTLRLDVAVAGVGSGACGPDVLEEHQVKCENIEFEFELRSITGASF